jgi:hypothetical protein
MPDEPIRTLLERIAGPAAAARPDLPAIGAALIELASDADYLARWIDRLEGRSGAHTIHGPARGPRLFLVHRPEGGMSAIHDHGTWVALATIAGIETHRRYRRGERSADRAPVLAEEVHLARSQVATLLPPDDIHDHGHLVGHGAPAQVLVLTGDDQTRFARNEWDLTTGRHRVLRPGVGGRWLASEPMPGD